MSIKRIRIAAFFISSVLAFSTHAKTHVLLEKCLDGKITNTEWAECSWQEVGRQEKLLDTIWKCVEAKSQDQLSDSYQALLKEQAAWKAYYNSACELYNNQIAFGREGQVIHYPSCKATIIEARINYLNTVLNMSSDEKCVDLHP